MKMTKKSIAVIVLTVIVFLSSVFLGVSATYRVGVVWLDPITISQESTSEVEEIHQLLVKAYEKKSYFSVNEKKAKEILSEFPYFRLQEFKKSAPNRVIVKIQEDEEVYAVPVLDSSNTYYVLGDNGTVLGIRDSYANRLDGENNVLLKGMKLSGEKGGTLKGEEIYAPLLSFCQTFSKKLNGIRRNVIEIEVLAYAESIVCVRMREGVKIYVGDVAEMPEEKATAAIEKYLSLSDENKLAGRIAVTSLNGRLNVDYDQKDLFE